MRACLGLGQSVDFFGGEKVGHVGGQKPLILAWGHCEGAKVQKKRPEDTVALPGGCTILTSDNVHFTVYDNDQEFQAPRP
jgi:hypothetical protein